MAEDTDRWSTPGRAATRDQLSRSTPETERRILRRSAILGIVVGVPSSAVFLWLALRGVDRDEVWRSIDEASIPWLSGVLVSFAGTYLMFSLRWATLLAPLGGISLQRVASLVLVGAALNNTVPGRPGEFARGYAVARAIRAPASAGIGSVVVDRACDVLLLGVALVVVVPFTPHPDWLGRLVLGAVAIGTVFVAVLLLAWWRVHGSGRRSRGLRGTRGRLREAASSFVEGLATLASLRDATRVVILSAGAWFCFGVGAYCCARAVGLAPTLEQMVFMTAVLNLGVALPSSPGFVGTYQWLIVSTFGLYDVPRNAAFAYSILLHASSFVPVTVTGYAVLALLALGQRRKRRSGHDHQIGRL